MKPPPHVHCGGVRGGAECGGEQRGVTGCNGVRGRNERGAVVFLFLFSFPNILCELRLFTSARAAASARGGPQLAVAPFACTPQAADRLCRSNRTGCYTGCCPPSQTAATAGCGPILSLIVNEASNSIIEVTVFEAPAARALRRGSRGRAENAVRLFLFPIFF